LAAGLGFAAAAPPAPAATAPAVVVCRNSLRCIFGLQLKAHLVTTGETPSSAQRVERSRLAYTRAARLLRGWRTARAIARQEPSRRPAPRSGPSESPRWFSRFAV